MHDYVIVGAGSAGCAIAARLSEDPARRVLLLEAGGSDRDPRVQAPSMMQLLWRSKLDWGFSTEPQAGALRRRMFWPRGKVLGGSSSLNAMVYVRGHREDYDAWRDRGCAGWGYAEVLPLFKKSEDNARGASAYHGVGGPLRVADQDVCVPVADAFAEAASRALGVPLTDDFNGAEQAGAGRYQVTMAKGERWSCSRGFLDPARDRPNLEIRPHAHATEIVITGDRARGVRAIVAGRETMFFAAREVIVCAGAIGSPQLLMLSGIGPGDALRTLGIEVKRELPGVGENLQDHLMVGVGFESTSPHLETLSVAKLASWSARWIFTRSGIMAHAPIPVGAFARIGAGEGRPDAQWHFHPWPPILPNTDEDRPLPPGRGIHVLPGLLHPKSRGTVSLRSKDPRQAPAIDPRYLSHEIEVAHLVEGIRRSREIANTDPLLRVVGREIAPGPEARSDDALAAHVRASCNTIFHPVGTCAMGVGEDAVVDPELRVRGIEGLRIADASVMPVIPGGNTHAAVVMIGERCAELIARER